MVALDLAKKMIMVRVCIEFVFVSQVLKCAHFYRIIALYANLKPNAVMVPIWLFPIQLEYIHICEECTFCKANREIGNGVTYVVHSNTLYLYFKYTCALLKRCILIHFVDVMLYQLQRARNVENVYSMLFHQTVTKIHFQVDQMHTILNLVCIFVYVF